MRCRRSVTLGLLALVACTPAARSPANEPTAEQDRAAIDRTRTAYVTAWRAGNAEQVAELYVEDALVLYPNQPAVAGRAAILAYFRSFFAEFVQDSFDLTSAEIEVAGSWAFDRGTYSWRATPRAGGAPLTDQGKYLVILRRQPDGSWKVARDMDNSDRPRSQTDRSAG